MNRIHTHNRREHRGNREHRDHRRGKRDRRRRRRVQRFLRTCLLVLLRHEERHGYALLPELEEYGFAEGTLDPSLVYRALRDMEADGWLQSNWDEESQGPRRRSYQLTDLGEEQLAYFIADLKRTRGEIDTLIQAYEKSGDKI